MGRRTGVVPELPLPVRWHADAATKIARSGLRLVAQADRRREIGHAGTRLERAAVKDRYAAENPTYAKWRLGNSALYACTPDRLVCVASTTESDLPAVRLWLSSDEEHGGQDVLTWTNAGDGFHLSEFLCNDEPLSVDKTPAIRSVGFLLDFLATGDQLRFSSGPVPTGLACLPVPGSV